MPGDERLAKLEERVNGIKDLFDKHEGRCAEFHREMREVVLSMKTSLAKYSGIAVLVMAGVVALVQIVIERLLK